jgi:hypothetical protein
MRIGETDERTVAGYAPAGTATHGEERQRALALALLPVEEPHANGHARVLAGVAVLNGPRHPGAARFRGRSLGL